MQDQLILIVLQ